MANPIDYEKVKVCLITVAGKSNMTDALIGAMVNNAAKLSTELQDARTFLASQNNDD